MSLKNSNLQTNSGATYNSAKLWQIALFVMNNTATNVAMVLIGYYAFFTQNILGLSAVIVGFIATAMRIFDGITDPIVGFFLDRTNGKFGKFRPYMLLGNIVLFVSILAIFRAPANWSIQQKYIYTTIWYIIYVLGYTFQCTCTKGAQASLTNDPKQRPLFTLFDSIYNVILFSGSAFIITTVMAPKYPKKLIDPALWSNVSLIFMIISFVLTILAIIGIWEKDRTEYFGLGEDSVKVEFKDYFEIIKNNRPLQMLILGASSDKLALVAVRGGLLYFFSNIILNSSLLGKYSMLAIIPSVLITFVGVGWARKSGLKKSFVVSSWVSSIFLIILIIITPIFSKGFNGTTTTSVIILLTIFALQQAVGGLAGNIVVPMIADCADYETYRSGRFIPGMIGTVFSFVDKLISSFATFIMGLAIAWAGYGNTVIEPNVPVNSKLYIAILFILFGLQLIGHIASIIGMKFYILDGPTMDKVKKAIADKKAAAKA